ncbi:hypothetical protein SAMN02745146_2829 [Hymenobacter daecheongensis DSM 21074]|uniref:Uncharacterized protein n=1 Tax=Hymenobacter daecheongensis DSM 21074 TaxID=1121955 RepID=A0A1M6I7Q4_9BACT|nr:HEPN domain-containing protein [Hymenobacter daecheongensis]SHJ30469.1 hypothetical protein SAMN02745146_2829 [Hymenobacter daecheongensis DSM 21074]
MISDDELKKLERLASYFENRKKEATERLKEEKGKYWYFAIIGFVSDDSVLEIEPLARIQKVENPAGEIELACALKNKNLFSSIGRYSQKVTYELAISKEFAKDDQGAFNIAWWIVSALRIRNLVEVLIPVVTDYSWSVIAALPDSSCYARLLEDIPQAKFYTVRKPVNQDDLNWVGKYLVSFVKLLEFPKFRLSVESITTHHFASSDRMAVATLWAGIEALFDIQSELRFRIAVSIASILEQRGIGRKNLYKTVKKMYDIRSKAVHGSPLGKIRIEDHIIDTKVLLSNLLCCFIEHGDLMNEEQIDDLIFG